MQRSAKAVPDGDHTHTEDLTQQEIERRRDEFPDSGTSMQARQGQPRSRSSSGHLDSRRHQRQEVRMDSKDTMRNESRNDPQRNQKGQGGQQGQGGQGGQGGSQGGRQGQDNPDMGGGNAGRTGGRRDDQNQ